MSLVGWLLFFVTLGILIFVHEMGHFLAAKAVGVQVDEFAFGFGPKLVTLMKRGGTEYTIRALPLGGFVSMPGMQPEDEAVPNGLMSKPAWARALVFVAGPVMNVLLALVVLCSMGMITGAPRVLPSGDVVHSRQVLQVHPNTEAARLDLRTGDLIVAIDGVPMKDGDQLIKTIQSHPGRKIELTVQRGSQTLQFQATPKPEPLDEQHPKTIVGRLGFEPGVIFKRLAFGPSIKAGLTSVQNYFVFLAQLVARPKLFGQSAGGPISMLRATNMNAQLAPGYQYSMLGQLSLSLAIFNLLPIPVLDGGHLAILLAEFFSRLFWRRRLGPEVHRVATAIGLAFICVLFLFLMYSDVARWVHHTPLQ
jgi:regulator of sigma E protease